MISALENIRKLRISILLFLALVIALQSLPATAQTCQPDGDVNQNGGITPADALLAFQHFLGLIVLDACQQDRANVLDSETTGITPTDACVSSGRFSAYRPVSTAWGTAGVSFHLRKGVPGLFKGRFQKMVDLGSAS